jgi:hypothetical protein
MTCKDTRIYSTKESAERQRSEGERRQNNDYKQGHGEWRTPTTGHRVRIPMAEYGDENQSGIAATVIWTRS